METDSSRTNGVPVPETKNVVTSIKDYGSTSSSGGAGGGQGQGQNGNNNNNQNVKSQGQQSPPSPLQQSEKTELKKEIGLIEGTALTVGAIIGSGIFISPKGILENVGSVGLSLVLWFASGVISMIGAVCYAELGTSFPSSGAEYHYLFVAFGPIPAFLFMWSSMMIFVPCNIAVLGLSFAQYVIKPFFSTCTVAVAADGGGVGDDGESTTIEPEVPDSALRLLAGVAICFVIFLNSYSVRAAARVQNLFGITKLTSLAVIVVLGAIALGQGKTSNFENPFSGSKTDVGSIALAFFSGIYAFGGANALNYVTEEIRNPSKTMPRSIYISMFLVITFYLLVNACYFTAMSPEEMLASDAVAVTFGDKTLGDYTWIIPVFVAIATFGGLLSNILPYSRCILVGARNGHFPQVLSHVQIKQLTPMASLLFMGFLSLIYLSTSNIYALINYAGFMYALLAVATAGAMLYLRWKLPNHPRPVKVHLFYPISYFIVSAFLFVLPIYVAPIEAAVGCGITLSGLPVYYIFIYKHEKSKFHTSINNKLVIVDSITKFVQKLLLCIPAEEEDDLLLDDDDVVKTKGPTKGGSGDKVPVPSRKTVS